MDLKKFAVPVVKAEPAKLELGDILPFMETCREQGVRITYAGLAVLARTLSVVPMTGQKLGQLGAKLVGFLPIEVQPYVCQAPGGYDAQAVASWTAAGQSVDLDFLMSMKPIPTDAILEAFMAWKSVQPD